MAHALDITDGIAAYADSRTDAWHQLGQQVGHAMTAQEAMKAAYLGGWDVRKRPAYALLENGRQLEMTDRAAVIRTNPINGQAEFLGDVGKDYRIIQNEEHADFLNVLVDESGAHFETAGALYGGRKVFLSMKLPGHMNAGGSGDKVDLYIVALNGHDGGTAFTLFVTPVRPVCANTVNVALAQAKNTFRIRHSSGAERVLRSDARRALELTFSYADAFNAAAEQLINTQLTNSQFEAIIQEEYGMLDSENPSVLDRAQGKIDDLMSLFVEAGTQEGIRETAWAGFQSIVEWQDHFSVVRGDDHGTRRALNAVLAPAPKQRAFDLMMAQV